MNTVLLVGFGAMGRFVYESLKGHPSQLRWVVLERESRHEVVNMALSESDELISSVEDLVENPTFAVECAGHDAVHGVIPLLLGRGVDTIMASVGALADQRVASMLEEACTRGNSQLTLVPGALAGVDALAAAKMSGLDSVRYSGRKPPRSWEGTHAEKLCDLAKLQVATTFFRGTAREAAQLFPQNANVAAMIGLAGLGLDYTEVELIADPLATGNTHAVQAQGSFGSMEMRLTAKAFQSNPKTSALAGMSVVRMILNRLNPVVI